MSQKNNTENGSFYLQFYYILSVVIPIVRVHVPAMSPRYTLYAEFKTESTKTKMGIMGYGACHVMADPWPRQLTTV